MCRVLRSVPASREDISPAIVFVPSVVKRRLLARVRFLAKRGGRVIRRCERGETWRCERGTGPRSGRRLPAIENMLAIKKTPRTLTDQPALHRFNWGRTMALVRTEEEPMTHLPKMRRKTLRNLRGKQRSG